MADKPPRYLIMDGRAFQNVDDAVVLDTADTRSQTIRRARAFGDIQKYEVAIVDSKKTDRVDMSFYGHRRRTNG